MGVYRLDSSLKFRAGGRRGDGRGNGRVLGAFDSGGLAERGCEGIGGFVWSVFTTAENCLAKNSVQPEASPHASQDDA